MDTCSPVIKRLHLTPMEAREMLRRNGWRRVPLKAGEFWGNEVYGGLALLDAARIVARKERGEPTLAVSLTERSE